MDAQLCCSVWRPLLNGAPPQFNNSLKLQGEGTSLAGQFLSSLPGLAVKWTWLTNPSLPSLPGVFRSYCLLFACFKQNNNS